MTQRDFAELCERIDRLLSEKETVAVAIDGDSCAGKTTLAARLSERYGVDAIHMDDFYLPLSLRRDESAVSLRAYLILSLLADVIISIRHSSRLKNTVPLF